MTIRLLIVDDQELVRASFRHFLEAQPDLSVVAEAADGAAALAQALSLSPDVVLMDIRMPHMDGIEATAAISRLEPRPSVIALTTFDLDEYVYGVLRAGAAGFLLKDVAPQGLVEAIRLVHAGDGLLAPGVTRRLIEDVAARNDPAPPPPELDELTARELEVLRLIASGLSNREIADALVVAEATVKSHIGRLLLKLGLRDRVQAVVFAYEHGVVTIGSGR